MLKTTGAGTTAKCGDHAQSGPTLGVWFGEKRAQHKEREEGQFPGVR